MWSKNGTRHTKEPVYMYEYKWYARYSYTVLV